MIFIQSFGVPSIFSRMRRFLDLSTALEAIIRLVVLGIRAMNCRESKIRTGLKSMSFIVAPVLSRGLGKLAEEFAKNPESRDVVETLCDSFRKERRPKDR
jgi:hypothetical protein